MVPKDLLLRNPPFNNQLINGLTICQLSPVCCELLGEGCSQRMTTFSILLTPTPVLGFLPSPIKLQCLALQLSWKAGPKGHRESPFPPCLYCPDRCLAWEQHSPISIRTFYWTGIKSQQFLSQVRKRQCWASSPALTGRSVDGDVLS